MHIVAATTKFTVAIAIQLVANTIDPSIPTHITAHR